MEKRKLPAYKLSAERPSSVQIFEFLRQLIIESYLLPGNKISENEIADHFNVSRMPVRTALNSLIHCGLVEVFPQKGSFVTKISAKNLSEICFMRCAIETGSLREGLKLSERDFNKIITKLERNLERQHKIALLKQTSVRAKFVNLDDEFHSIICMFSSTKLAWETLLDLKANMDRIRFFTIYEAVSTMESLVHEHDMLFKYIKEKNMDKACEVLSNHLYEITKTYSIIQKEHSSWFLDE